MGTSNPTFSTPPPSSSSNSFSAAARSSIVRQKQVFLCEWWLEKAVPTSGGGRLSIGGCTERPGTRIFHSAAVLKRHDTVTLGTADGILVKISGAINKSRTLENGFPREVCRHFLYGFPYDWEDFADQPFIEESTNSAIPRGLSNLDGSGVSSVNGLNRCSHKSFGELPVSLLRDFSDSSVEYSATCEMWKSMFKDILQKYGGSAKDQAVTETSSREETPSKQKNSTVGQSNRDEDDSSIRTRRTSKDRMILENSSKEGTPIKHNSTIEQNNRGQDDMSVSKSRRQKLQKVALDKGTSSDSNVVSKVPCTRSTTRSKDSRNKQEESISVNHAGKTVSNVTETTRKLKLRNRFVEVHVKHFA